MHADIDEEVYIEQPEGYLNNKLIIKDSKGDYNSYSTIRELSKSRKVLRLKKALYSLKQSPRL